MNFAALSAEDAPKTLYHYTSLEALQSIVKSKKLRASNIRFLNDMSETLIFRQDVLEVLRQRANGGERAQALAELIDHIESRPLQSLFVASFSEKGDLLSQWRAYCPPGLGVSIGFNSSCLQENWVWNPHDNQEPFFLSSSLTKIRYYGKSQRAELEQDIDDLIAIDGDDAVFAAVGMIISLFPGSGLPRSAITEVTKIFAEAIIKVEGGPNSFNGFRSAPPLRSVAAWIAMLAPLIKHDAFEEEREWRKVVSKDFRNMPGQQFRMGKSTLIPFIEVMLNVVTKEAECVAREDDFIHEVIVGPTPTPELTVEALHSFFQSEGYSKVEVRISQVPFRSW